MSFPLTYVPQLPFEGFKWKWACLQCTEGIHILYDANELRILPDGTVELSQRARLSYGALIPPSIVLPEWIDRENIRWRCDNYRGY